MVQIFKQFNMLEFDQKHKITQQQMMDQLDRKHTNTQ